MAMESVRPPKLAVMGFSVIDLGEVIAVPPQRHVSPEEHMRVAERAYVSGATHMARLHLARAQAARRRLLLERTKWGAGVLLALVFGWLLRGMQP